MPMTEDLVMFTKYILDNVVEILQALAAEEKASDWLRLSKLIMVRLILFNKRRGFPLLL